MHRWKWCPDCRLPQIEIRRLKTTWRRGIWLFPEVDVDFSLCQEWNNVLADGTDD